MTYQIGKWRFQPERNGLSAGGETVSLENRTARVLEYLCQNPNRVIPKDELLDQVWGRSAVSDHSVAIVISDLRKALGDSAKKAKLIKTIPKRGYLYVPPDREGPRETAFKKLSWRLGWIAGVAAVLFIAAAIYLPRFAPAQRTLVFHDLRSLEDGPEGNFLAESLTEILLVELSKVQDLRLVRIRTTPSRIAAGSIPPGQFVKDEDLVFSGSVSPAAQGFLLTLKLEAGAEKQVLWGYSEEVTERYHFISGRHALQDLYAELGWQAVDTREFANDRAERLFWRAVYLWESREAQDTRASHQTLLEVLSIEPGFARAHAQLAIIYAHKTGPYLGFESPYLFDRAEEQLALAEEGGEGLPELSVSRALIAFYRDRNYPAALEALDNGLDDWPNNPLLWHTRGMVSSALGQHEESLYSIEKARALDPLSRSINWDRVWFLYLAGRFEEALQAAREAERFTGVIRYYYLALIQEALGDRAGAFNSWLQLLRDVGMTLSFGDISPGEDVDFPQMYRGLFDEVEHQGKNFYPEAVKAFWAYLAQDEETALHLLETMPVVQENWVYYWLPEIPLLAGLRDNERFQALITASP